MNYTSDDHVRARLLTVRVLMGTMCWGVLMCFEGCGYLKQPSAPIGDIEASRNAHRDIVKLMEGVDRLELTLAVERESGMVRAGPIIVTDKSFISLIRSEIAQLTSIELNPFPHMTTVSGEFLEMTLIDTKLHQQERIRITGSATLLALGHSEQYRGTLRSDAIFERAIGLVDELVSDGAADLVLPWN